MSKKSAQQVREAIKALGYGPRQVSVRNESYAGGSSVRVVVKDAAVDFAAVEAAASAYQSVRYCHASGEILSGGNMYVSVCWDHDLQREHGVALGEYLLTIPVGRSSKELGVEVVRVEPGRWWVNLDGRHVDGNSCDTAYRIQRQVGLVPVPKAPALNAQEEFLAAVGAL